MNTNSRAYGVSDNSYKAAGELVGITRLVDDFYDNMSAFPEAKKIRDMHPSDLTESRTKLAYFLSGWLGGPRIYAATFGSLSIPSAHQHLPVGESESEAWLHCMQKALENQPYEEAFKVYLIAQLRVPAERIRAVCARTSRG
jgi:hemoglobin